MEMESMQFVEPGVSDQNLLATTQELELEDAHRKKKNLTSQVESFRAKIKDLESTPHQGADIHNFVERNEEMKGSLSSLKSVLEESNKSNTSLTARIMELEFRVKAGEGELLDCWIVREQ
jgi:peptidoglycan hydrolase CwlO-like protein